MNASRFLRPAAAVCLLALSLASPLAQADHLQMVRIENPFPETMSQLQTAIQDAGYQISRVQRVDVGLTKSGYKTAQYRVVFYGRYEEVRRLSTRYPNLIPYLPLKFVIFAEGNDTLILANNPTNLSDFYKDARLKKQFVEWERDIRTIMQQVQRASRQ